MDQLTEAQRFDLENCGFNRDDIGDIESCLSTRPQWHDRPTCPGLWMRGKRPHGIHCFDDDDFEIAATIDNAWYGPIPAPPEGGKS
jgi:hypothetical protein